MNKKIVVMLLALSATACSGLVGEIGDLKPKVEVSIASLQGFVITEKVTTQLARAEGPPLMALYGVDANNGLVRITISTNPEESILAVHDTPKYVLLEVMGVSHGGQPCRLVPLRKSDGALFCLPHAVSLTPYVGPGLTPVIQTDASGELLFVMTEVAPNVWGTLVSRLDMRDPENPVETVLVPESAGYHVWRLVVNADGDALLALSPDALKLFPINGPAQNLTGRRTQCHVLGPTGDEISFYYSGANAENVSGVHKLTKQEDGSFTSSLYSASEPDITGCHSFARTAKAAYVRSVAPSVGFYEMVNLEGTVVARAIPGTYSTPPYMRPTGDGLIAWDFETIRRYTFETGEMTTLLDAGQYRISTLDSAPSGELTFSGTRLSDGVRIVGSHSPEGLKITAVEEGGTEVRQIIRIR